MGNESLDEFKRFHRSIDSIDWGSDWFEDFTRRVKKESKPIYQEIKESDSYINSKVAKELLE
jgi:hypothetical protein